MRQGPCGWRSRAGPIGAEMGCHLSSSHARPKMTAFMSTSFGNGVFVHRGFRPVIGWHFAGTSLGLWLVIGCFSLVFLSFSNFTPLWDGWVYSEGCILHASRQPFSVSNFNCFGHPTFAYAFSVALLQYLDRGNVALINLANWLLGVLGIFSFYRVSQKLFKGWCRIHERVLLTAIFAFMPLFICNGVNPNPDFGIVVFTMALLWSLFWHHYVLQALFGLCLTFCKETGVLIYVVIVATHFVLYVPRPLQGVYAKLQYLVCRSHLVIPAVVFGVFILARMTPSSGYWAVHSSQDALGIIRYVTSFSLLEKSFVSYTFGALVNNYNWLLTLLVLMYGVKWAWCRVWGTPHPVHRNQIFTFVVTALSFLAVTRYQSFSNYRYVAVTGPLLALTAFWSLLRLFHRPAYRTALLSLVLALVSISNWHTADPVSKRWINSTFKFGTHEMLPIGLAMGDQTFPGFDQIQYNLQYTNLDSAMNEIFTAIDPEKNMFVVTRGGNWSQLTRLAKSDHHRTMRFNDTLEVQFAEAPEFSGRASKPATVYYIAFPNMGEDAKKNDMELLGATYAVKETRQYGHGGYFIEVLTMVRKSG